MVTSSEIIIPRMRGRGGRNGDERRSAQCWTMMRNRRRNRKIWMEYDYEEEKQYETDDQSYCRMKKLGECECRGREYIERNI